MNDNGRRFLDLNAHLPLVAILRGVRPEEVVTLAEGLVTTGIRVIEVPLNSPDAFTSIESLVQRFRGPDVMIGAGTVLEADQVVRLHETGARLVVMPHADTEVIRAAVRHGMACVPGVATPTEAFAALRAGAHALKVFPAELADPPVIRSMLAVLPAGTCLLPVGGITAERMRDYWAAGARGFGLGSGLYRPGMEAATLAARARDYVIAAQHLIGEPEIQV